MLAYGFNPTSPDTTGGNLTKVPSMNLPGISADDSLMLLRAATELSFSSILVTDAQHRILYANPAFCATTGYSPDELEGQNPRILQGPLTDKSVIEKLHYDRDTTGHFTGSTFNYRKGDRRLSCGAPESPSVNTMAATPCQFCHH